MMRHSLSIVFVMLASASAAAEPDLTLARHDIVDARQMREPQRVHVLGWAADGSAYVRKTACAVADASGHFSCFVSITRYAPDGKQTKKLLLNIPEALCDHEKKTCANVITYPIARDFLAAEAAYRAAMPPLVAGTELADPTKMLGADATLAMRATALPDLGMDLALVARRNAKVVILYKERQSEGRMDSGFGMRGWLSPDGTKAILMVRYRTGVMCWGPFKNLDVHHIDIAATRVKLQ